jgi:site-specific recombinase XerD
MDIAGSMEEFLLAGLSSGWSERTAGGYGWRVKRLRLWLSERQVLTVKDLTRRKLREWAGSLTGAPATRRGAIVAARAWLSWLHAEGDLPEAADLLRALVAPQVPATVQRTITIEEIITLLAVADEPATRGVSAVVAGQVCARNRALVALLFDALLRASELCALQVGDVDLGGGVVTVRRGKGGRGRLAPFGSVTADLLRVWLSAYPPASLQAPLFVALGGWLPGKGLTPRGLGVILQRLGERAGIAAVSPHAFRRGGACEAVWNGASSRVVMSVGGWSNLQMVERYTRDMELRQGRNRDEYRHAAPMSGTQRSGS